jgi:D-beta-D-heptose 7-phosphate kinase/D-beta-D-heptose 1-phosphate adenosyltransferase
MIEPTTTQQQKQFKILLIGDECVDTYVYGTVDRISPEAPVPVFQPKYEIVKDGMAGNVRKNLEALGCDVQFLHGNTSRKKRIIDERSKQQLLRIDNDAVSEPITIDSELPDIYNAIVISDYNKGTVSYELVEDLRSRFNGPIFIDTKKTDLARFNGCFVKINQVEKKRAVSLPDKHWLIVTHGDSGAVWNDWVFPAEVVGDVTDVTGAGDTFLAAFAYEFLVQEYVQAAVKFAIKASGITVQHIGVYAPRLEQIK